MLELKKEDGTILFVPMEQVYCIEVHHEEIFIIKTGFQIAEYNWTCPATAENLASIRHYGTPIYKSNLQNAFPLGPIGDKIVHPLMGVAICYKCGQQYNSCGPGCMCERTTE